MNGLDELHARYRDNLVRMGEPKDWLSTKGIDWHVALDACVGWLPGYEPESWMPVPMSSAGKIVYPCYGDTGLRGFKLRNIQTGRVRYEPEHMGLARLPPWRAHRSEGLPEAVLFTEGETDGLALATALRGSQWAQKADIRVVPGANAFRPEWEPLFVGLDVYVFGDGDSAGNELRVTIAQIMPRARLVEIPPGYDIVDFIREYGREPIPTLLDAAKAMPLFDIPDRKIPRERTDKQDELAPLLMPELQAFGLRMFGYNSEWKAYCPYPDHDNERTPAFTINSERGVYRCYGCGKRGNVVIWLKDIRGMSNDQIADYLEQHYGVRGGQRGRRKQSGS